MWKILLNLALSQLHPRDICDAIMKWLDNYTHKTNNTNDDAFMDAILKLWEKFREYIPNDIQIAMAKKIQRGL